MIIENQKDVTTAVLAELQRAPDARFKEIMSALVRHLHDFVRETKLSEEEFQAAVGYVVARGVLDPAALAAWLAQQLPEYKHLAEVVVCEAIPKTPSGKILRRVLRAQDRQPQA